MTLSDKFGRRVLLLVSLILVVISYFGLGLYFKLRDIYGDSSPDFMSSISWMPLTSLIGYIIACSTGIVPLSWVITAEIAPPKAKGKCITIFNASWYLTNPTKHMYRVGFWTCGLLEPNCGICSCFYVLGFHCPSWKCWDILDDC